MNSQVYPDCNTRLNHRQSRRRGHQTFGVLLLLGMLLSVLLADPAYARGSSLKSLTKKEQSRLEGHWDAQRRFYMKVGGRKYLGGLSYQVSDHSCSRVWSLMENPVDHYARALPATRSVERADRKNPNKLLVTHGTALINGSYTVDFHADDENYVAKFWLDQSRPKDVEDVFGYIKLSHFQDSRCLITVGVAVDPGEGLVASLFSGMIQNYVVRSAGRIARYARSALPPQRTTVASRSID